MSAVNWAPPVYGSDVQTSEAYLERLQSFLAMQGESSSSSSNKDTDTGKSKRKSLASKSDIDTASALKDRRQSAGKSHTHIDGRDESPEDTDKGSKGKASTTEKRKEQNRNAQRAFRERKERVLKDLEDKIDGLNKVNEEQLVENQNLKEMVTRLQAENARLQKSTSTPASSAGPPQSDFTFSVPSTDSSPPTGIGNAGPQAGSSSANLASLSDSEFYAMLNSSSNDHNAQSSEQPFTIIQPSYFPPLEDNWSWNSSSFGTELPQAASSDVQHFRDLFAATDGAAQAPGSSSSSPQQANSGSTPNAGRQQSANAAHPGSGMASGFQDSAGLFNSLFNSFSPSASVGPSSFSRDGAGGASSSAAPGASASGTRQDGTNNVSSAVPGASLHEERNTNNGPRNPLVRQAISNHGSSSAEASPEATCSSAGSSEPYDNAPPTPVNSVPFASFGTTRTTSGSSAGFPPTSNGFGLGPSSAGNSPNNWYDSFRGSSNGFTSSNASSIFAPLDKPTLDARHSGNGVSAFTATTPSGVFDAMNYRDPLLTNNGGSGDDNRLDFEHLLAGSEDGGVDFSDFLVQSPPALSSGTSAGTPASQGAAPSPAQQQQQHHPSRHSSSAASTSTSGTIESQSQSHHRRSQPSSSNSPPSLASSSASSPSTGLGLPAQANDILPYDLTYGHPLIKYAFSSNSNQTFAPALAPRTNASTSPSAGKPFDGDIDGLCSDMRMKATCKELARDRIAQSIQSDEKMLELYNDYLRSGKQ